MATILLNAADGNLLLGFMPESLGLLIFGVALVFIAVVLRRMFDRNDKQQAEKNFQQPDGKINQ